MRRSGGSWSTDGTEARALRATSLALAFATLAAPASTLAQTTVPQPPQSVVPRPQDAAIPPPPDPPLEDPTFTTLALPEGFESDGRRLAEGQRSLVVHVTQPSHVALRLRVGTVRDERYVGRRRSLSVGVYVNLCAGTCDLRLVPGMRYRVEAFPVSPTRDSHRVHSESVFTLPDDAVELRISYEDRSKQRRRRWIGVSVPAVLGAILMGLAYAYRSPNDVDGRTRALFVPGALLATSPLYTFPLPLLTGDRMYVQVRRANGSVVATGERPR